MSFASRLRQAREQAGFTQQDLAKKLGVTKNAISNYENGVSSPKWEILVEIFDILHVDPNFLYQDDFSSELAEAHVLTPQQSTLLAAFDQLNDEGQTRLWSMSKTSSSPDVIKNVLRLAWAQRKHKK